ncbi:MAG: hypothetical protein IJ011_09390 [Clostridia bacterium]|nr:hypothetical protein [Clostridia bacterium]
MKNIKKYLSFAIALCICATALFTLFSCNKDQNDPSGDSTKDSTSDTSNTQPTNTTLALFDGESFAGKLVYESTADSYRKSISNALKDVLDKRPDAITDTEEAADTSVVEILVGATNRPESSQITGVAENDAWYFVGVIGNKLVINGSNSYMLGLAVEYFINTTLSSASANTAFSLSSANNEQVVWEDFSDEDWRISEIPYFKGETAAYSTAVYSSARLLSEYNKSNADFVKLLTVKKTNETEIGAYVEKLKTFGYTEELRDTLDKNVYITMTKGDETVYMYYTQGGSSVKVIYDAISDTVAEVSTPAVTPAAGEGAVFYQYGLNQSPYEYPNTGVVGYPNNGMMYIVKCADNSVLIFDGGSSTQMTDSEASKPMEDLDAFLRKITGVSEGEKVTIAAWILTHMHGDHYSGFSKFITAYAQSYELKSIVANVPYNYASEVDGATVTGMKNLASTLAVRYPDLKEIVIHTGQKLTFADVTVQALYTHEECVSALTGVASYGQFNNTSTVFKVSTENMSMMVLGDSIDLPEDYILKTYSDETLKCDIVQVAHHAHDGVDNIYESIKAEIYLVPNSYGGWEYREVDYEGKNWPEYIRGEVLEGNILPKYCRNYGEEGEMLFFSGKSTLTVGFAYVNGEVAVVYAPEELNTVQPVLPGDDTATNFGDIDFV